MKTKHTQQEKTAVQAGATKTVATTIRTICIVLVAVLVPATFLLSVFFPATPSNLTEIKSERKAKSKLIENYKDSVLAKDANLISLIQDYEETNSVYKEKKKSEYISGFPSMHKFLWNFGIGLIILTLSIYLLATINSYNGIKKKAANVSAMLFMTASGFYMAWIFFPEDDLPIKAYFTCLFAIGILSAITSYWMTKIRWQSRQHLVNTIRNLFSFIYTETDKEKYISPDKKEEYVKRRVELVNEAVNHE